MDETKLDLINYRVQRAKETIDEADLAIRFDKLRLAENRIYYSIFYIVSALALKYDYSTSKHKQLIGWFNKNFIHTDIAPKELSHIYRYSFERRQEDDYEDKVYFDIEEVKKHYQDMLIFVEEIEKVILK